MKKSKFPTCTLEDQEAVAALLEVAKDARARLRRSIAPFEYPRTMRLKSRQPWQEFVTEIKALNQAAIGDLSGRAGVYAIFSSRGSQGWKWRYVGQVNGTGCRQRVLSHLVWRNKETPSGSYTGSKFDEVAMLVRMKANIGFSFVQIEPPTLRHYVESYLINRCKPEWNIQGSFQRAKR